MEQKLEEFVERYVRMKLKEKGLVGKVPFKMVDALENEARKVWIVRKKGHLVPTHVRPRRLP